MSNIFKSENIDSDFVNFKKEIFKTNSFIATNKVVELPSFKKFHKLLYAFSLIQFKTLKKHKDLIYRFIFLQEIQSDFLMFSALLFQGFYNSAMIQYRRIIENFYNHIYYFDHEIEFIKLNNGKNEYSPLIELKNYLNSYPYLNSKKTITNFNDHIFLEYTELNKIVHTKGIEFMSLSKNIKDIKNEVDFDNTFLKTNDVLYRMIYILYKFHNNIEFTNVEKRTISDCVPKKYRKELND